MLSRIASPDDDIRQVCLLEDKLHVILVHLGDLHLGPVRISRHGAVCALWGTCCTEQSRYAKTSWPPTL